MTQRDIYYLYIYSNNLISRISFKKFHSLPASLFVFEASSHHSILQQPASSQAIAELRFWRQFYEDMKKPLYVLRDSRQLKIYEDRWASAGSAAHPATDLQNGNICCSVASSGSGAGRNNKISARPV